MIMNITATQITPERERELVEKLVDLLSSRYDAGDLYDILCHGLGIDVYKRQGQDVAIDISRVQRSMMNDKPKQPVVMASVRVDTQGVDYPAPETH